jgi:hypothetical protein
MIVVGPRAGQCSCLEADRLATWEDRFVQLVDRDGGTAIAISYCETADDARRADRLSTRCLLLKAAGTAPRLGSTRF